MTLFEIDLRNFKDTNNIKFEYFNLDNSNANKTEYVSSYQLLNYIAFHYQNNLGCSCNMFADNTLIATTEV